MKKIMYEYFRSKRINKYIYIHTLYMYTDYTCLHRNNCFHHKVFLWDIFEGCAHPRFASIPCGATQGCQSQPGSTGLSLLSVKQTWRKGSRNTFPWHDASLLVHDATISQLLGSGPGFVHQSSNPLAKHEMRLEFPPILFLDSNVFV